MRDGLGFAIFAAKALLKNSWVDGNVVRFYEDDRELVSLADFWTLFCDTKGLYEFFGLCFDAGMYEDEVCDVLEWALKARYESIKGGCA